MEELNVVVEQTPGVIKCNLSEIKEALKLQMTAYTSLEITEDKIKIAKSDLATLRKIRTAVDDRRKEIKKAFSEPYDVFEQEVKEVLAVIDEPIGMIDKKLKEFDAARAAEKLNHVKELYSENIGELEEYLPFDKIFNKKWLNATVNDKEIVYDISEHKTKVMSDLDILHGLGSEIEEEIIKVYKNTGNDLAMAIKRNSSYMEDKARVKAMEEEKAKAKAAEEARVETPAAVEIPKEELKPAAETMGALNEVVELTKTVKFIVSKSDAEDVENLLNLSGISFRKVEEG